MTIEVPKNVKQAYALDIKNGNSKWSDAMNEEITSLHKYNTFKDHGKISYVPDKVRLIAGGHLTDSSIDGTYSGVVSLRSLCMCMLAAELNQLHIMVGDI